MSHDDSVPGERRPNHLLGQTSPYLLQHLYNPVDWYAWGPEALERAAAENKPIFISIGYAACHWCHVMERESFEDVDVATFLNRNFVPIKVDREERPDLDEIYMNAVQMMTGAGGWPLNVFLTPDRRPFMGGTYFPPDNRYGRPGFSDLLHFVRDAWETRREEVLESAGQMSEHLRQIAAGAASAGDSPAIGREECVRAASELTARFDARWGGFGGAPKFPQDGALALLLREHDRTGEPVPLQMAEHTLERMAVGGIYDHLGGGFARYSVDDQWLVPHFEKMLYNQALLVPLCVDAWLISGKPLYRRAAEQTLDFVRRELTGAEGGCHSSLDADSEGREGTFYVWSPDEVLAELGEEEGRLVCDVYGIDAAGNFEGRSIPNLLGASLAQRAERDGLTESSLDERLAPLRARLLDARERRVRPASDDKILTAWNGLIITAFARSHQAFTRQDDLGSARRAADFALAHLANGERLFVSFREGRAHLNGHLDDYAFLARGLLDLYESCFEPHYLLAAQKLAHVLVERFEDREHGGFFFVSDDHEELIARNRSQQDGALPSGAGVATETLFRLGLLLDDEKLESSARRALASYQPIVARAPSAFGALLTAADLAVGPVVELALIGDPTDPAMVELLGVARRRYLPRRVIAVGPPDEESPIALLRGKTTQDDRPTAYVCENRACREPTTDPRELVRLLAAARTDGQE